MDKHQTLHMILDRQRREQIRTQLMQFENSPEDRLRHEILDELLTAVAELVKETAKDANHPAFVTAPPKKPPMAIPLAQERLGYKS